ncbi:hypothetical protein COBT_002058 [Conglomerata obtusa]
MFLCLWYILNITCADAEVVHLDDQESMLPNENQNDLIAQVVFDNINKNINYRNTDINSNNLYIYALEVFRGCKNNLVLISDMVETLIKKKIFAECVVYIHIQDSAIDIYRPNSFYHILTDKNIEILDRKGVFEEQSEKGLIYVLKVDDTKKLAKNLRRAYKQIYKSKIYDTKMVFERIYILESENLQQVSLQNLVFTFYKTKMEKFYNDILFVQSKNVLTKKKDRSCFYFSKRKPINFNFLDIFKDTLVDNTIKIMFLEQKIKTVKVGNNILKKTNLKIISFNYGITQKCFSRKIILNPDSKFVETIFFKYDSFLNIYIILYKELKIPQGTKLTKTQQKEIFLYRENFKNYFKISYDFETINFDDGGSHFNYRILDNFKIKICGEKPNEGNIIYRESAEKRASLIFNIEHRLTSDSLISNLIGNINQYISNQMVSFYVQKPHYMLSNFILHVDKYKYIVNTKTKNCNLFSYINDIIDKLKIEYSCAVETQIINYKNYSDNYFKNLYYETVKKEHLSATTNSIQNSKKLLISNEEKLAEYIISSCTFTNKIEYSLKNLEENDLISECFLQYNLSTRDKSEVSFVMHISTFVEKLDTYFEAFGNEFYDQIIKDLEDKIQMNGNYKTFITTQNCDFFINIWELFISFIQPNFSLFLINKELNIVFDLFLSSKYKLVGHSSHTEDMKRGLMNLDEGLIKEFFLDSFKKLEYNKNKVISNYYENSNLWHCMLLYNSKFTIDIEDIRRVLICKT